MFDKNHLDHNLIKKYSNLYTCNKCNIDIVYWDKCDDYYDVYRAHYKYKMYDKELLSCDEWIIKGIIE
jgi:hypothetical protein